MYTKINRKWIAKNFIIDKEKGVLVHKTGRNAGKVGGCENAGGYIVIKKDNKTHYVHRIIAQSISHHSIHNYHVHHKNGDQGDNRPENLVMITAQQHITLRKTSGRQTLKYKGIIKRTYAYGLRYFAKIVVAGVHYFGPKRTTQWAAHKDYCALFVKHRGLVHAPADVVKTYYAT